MNFTLIRMDMKALKKYWAAKEIENENDEHYASLPRFYNYDAYGRLAYETFDDYVSRRSMKPKPAASKPRRKRFKKKNGR